MTVISEKVKEKYSERSHPKLMKINDSETIILTSLGVRDSGVVVYTEDEEYPMGSFLYLDLTQFEDFRGTLTLKNR